jgi:hypothetical protein
VKALRQEFSSSSPVKKLISESHDWEISFFAANNPIASSARPATDIDKAVREKTRNRARMVGCMDSRTDTSS